MPEKSEHEYIIINQKGYIDSLTYNMHRMTKFQKYT